MHKIHNIVTKQQQILLPVTSCMYKALWHKNKTKREPQFRVLIKLISRWIATVVWRQDRATPTINNVAEVEHKATLTNFQFHNENFCHESIT